MWSTTLPGFLVRRMWAWRPRNTAWNYHGPALSIFALGPISLKTRSYTPVACDSTAILVPYDFIMRNTKDHIRIEWTMAANHWSRVLDMLEQRYSVTVCCWLPVASYGSHLCQKIARLTPVSLWRLEPGLLQTCSSLERSRLEFYGLAKRGL